MRLRKQFKTSNNPPPGSVGYLVSCQWVLKYKQYLQYKSIKANKPVSAVNNVAHPGIITNHDFLHTDHRVYLPGSSSGTEKGQETECIDRYIKSTCFEYRHFQIFSAESWEFVNSRYGCDFEVRRYYYKGRWEGSTMEINMKQVPIIIFKAAHIKQDFELKWV
jgi:hypothetical protein